MNVWQNVVASIKMFATLTRETLNGNRYRSYNRTVCVYLSCFSIHISALYSVPRRVVGYRWYFSIQVFCNLKKIKMTRSTFSAVCCLYQFQYSMRFAMCATFWCERPLVTSYISANCDNQPYWNYMHNRLITEIIFSMLQVTCIWNACCSRVILSLSM